MREIARVYGGICQGFHGARNLCVCSSGKDFLTCEMHQNSPVWKEIKAQHQLQARRREFLGAGFGAGFGPLSSLTGENVKTHPRHPPGKGESEKKCNCWDLEKH